ncbi:SSPO protein, partial [Aphelocoma coerulescens]|nr:SSPO protein [Aphelocoma coerulescens]
QERGRWRVPGERWRGGPCQVCQCLPGGGVRCVPYCPLRDTGCPQGQVLREGDGVSCCTCGPAGDNATATLPAMMTALPPPAPAEPPGSPGPTAGSEGPPRPPPSGWPKSAETPPEPPSVGGGTLRTATPPEGTPRP